MSNLTIVYDKEINFVSIKGSEFIYGNGFGSSGMEGKNTEKIKEVLDNIANQVRKLYHLQDTIKQGDKVILTQDLGPLRKNSLFTVARRNKDNNGVITVEKILLNGNVLDLDIEDKYLKRVNKNE